jgi:hypothetical protein
LSPRPPKLATLSSSMISILLPLCQSYLCESVYGNNAKKRERLIAVAN